LSRMGTFWWFSAALCDSLGMACGNIVGITLKCQYFSAATLPDRGFSA
jgi:hypothetical protein